MKILAAALALAFATSAAFVTPALACGDRYGAPPAADTAPTEDPKPAIKLAKKAKAKAKKGKNAKKVAKAERATGQWPSLVERDGKLFLELHYPRFEQSGEHLYMDTFEIVDD